ncbi:hypothetical protein DF185_22555 [Marinifilum breve]|uniref:Uncharacterized protein n=2 Tax=Marinifilum breve TaxID=2184082 RepID=A0A2V3ZRJ1_9BACT|nr:hypothetical protein DF185_22555 [Marinifilum breve]
MLFSSVVFSQQEKCVFFKLVNTSIKNENLNLKMSIENTGDTSLIVYKPSLEAICLSILKVSLIDIESGEIYDVFPCEEVIDLDGIKVNYKDFICLNSHEIFAVNLSFSLNDIVPYLMKNKKYSIRSKFLLSGVDFYPKKEGLVQSDLISNKLPIFY